MQIDGRCHCGSIAYTATVDPEAASLCHCTDCQTFSGAPFRGSVPARAEDFRLLQGQPQIYVKVADSGSRRAQAFCGDCGTPIYSTAAENPTLYFLRLGAVTQRTQIQPRKQIWCSSALEWAQDIRALPGQPKG